MVVFGAKSETVPGPDIKINCPFCNTREADAATGEVCETATVMFIPVSRSKYTLVKCVVCNTVLKAKVPLDRLIDYSAEDIHLQGLLRLRGGLAEGFFAVSSIFFSVGPLFGPLWAILAIILNRKSPAWMRITAKIGLALSIFWNLLFLYRITSTG